MMQTFPNPAPRLTETHIEPFVRGTLDGDPKAWPRFWLAVDPTVETIVGRFRSCGPLGRREDERRDVVVHVMERFRANDFQRLRSFHEVLLRGDGSFRAWLSVMTRRTALNHARLHAENLGEGEGETPAQRRWIELLPLPEVLVDDVPVATRAADLADARRIQAYVKEHIPPQPQEALNLWLSGCSHAEIAAALNLEEGPKGAHAAKLMVSMVVNHLRRRFPDR